MERTDQHDAPACQGGSLSEKVLRGDIFAEQCPSRQVLNHVTSRWGVLVLIALTGGTLRFSELRRKIGGVSERMLAQTLQWLAGDGFVSRKSYPVVPPHVEYSLTPLGREVAAHVAALADWIEDRLPGILESQRGADEAELPSGCVDRTGMERAASPEKPNQDDDVC